MKRTVRSTLNPLALAVSSVLLAGSVQAESSPYAAWQQSSDDDKTVSTHESYNRDYRVNEDNDVSKTYSKDIDITKTRSEDNDSSYAYESNYDSKYESNKDIDYTNTTPQRRQRFRLCLRSEPGQRRHQDDWTNTEDNDYTYTSSEDNDVHKHFEADLDSQYASSTQDVHKYQDQHAGHQGESYASGSAEGHDTMVKGGYTNVAAGNDEMFNYGTQISNVNQMPTNYLFVGGSNMAPIDQSNQSAGRDLGAKGVFAPVGNVGVEVLGNTGNHTASGVDQAGSASNSIADPVYSEIRR